MGAPKPTETVSAEPAREDKWQPQITAVGSLSSVNGIDVTPQIAGIIKAIYFDSGQYVEKGAKLVELDTDTEMADLKNFEAQQVNAEATLARNEKILAKGFVSQAEVDNALSRRNDAVRADPDTVHRGRGRAYCALMAITSRMPVRLAPLAVVIVTRR